MATVHASKAHMRLTSIHPGVELGRVQARTGFELDIAPDLHETPLPTERELRLLREEIDPSGHPAIRSTIRCGKAPIVDANY